MSSQEKVHLKPPSPTAGKGGTASTPSDSRSEGSLEPRRTPSVSPEIYTASGERERKRVIANDVLQDTIMSLFVSDGNVQHLTRIFVHITPCSSCPSERTS